MSKMILLIYPSSPHRHIVHKLADLLVAKNILLDSFCIGDFCLYQKTKIKWPFILIFLIYISKIPVPKLKSLLRYIIKRKIKECFKLYDIIDFHGFYPIYYKMMEFCFENNIVYDITVWGSDIMRADEQKFKDMKNGFQYCHYIKGAENLLEIITKKYNGQFDDKMRCLYWGNPDFDVIDSITDTQCVERAKVLLGDINGKIIVTCGYNGVPNQQHSFIVDTIASLSDDIKKNLYIVLPMTYGGTNKYIEIIRRKMSNYGLMYKIFDSFLPIYDIAVLRKITNITINIQETDAFSGSLQDHLYCRNILVLGEWLRYIPLEREKVFYINTSMEKLRDEIIKSIKNIDNYKIKTFENKNKMHNLTSWSVVIDKWADSYKK